MGIHLSKQDLIGLMKEKNPKKYRKLKQQKQLQSWAKQELADLRETYDQLLKDNPKMNTIEAAELTLEGYL